jgi:hypothetical protein
MKYHNNGGRVVGSKKLQTWQFGNTRLSNFDFYSTYYLTMTNISQHKLQYNMTEIQQNKDYCCAD